MSSKTLKQRGDTIVEVLLAMTVIAVVVASAFSTATRSLNAGRSAQERTEALKLAETQLELLKVYYPIASSIRSPGWFGLYGFCVDNTKTDTNLDGDWGEVAVRGDNEKCNNRTSDNQVGGLYRIIIGKTTDVYRIEVVWQRLGAKGATVNSRLGRVVLFYKVGAL